MHLYKRSFLSNYTNSLYKYMLLSKLTLSTINSETIQAIAMDINYNHVMVNSM